jgi:acetyl esterase/lipase
VTVEAQIQEVAHALGFLTRNAAELGIDPQRLVLMGHSSGAHVVALLGTDASYLTEAGVNISNVRGVIALDGSNYNAMAEFQDSPGPVANNLASALGTDPARLRAMSPTYHTRSPNAGAFLLLHAQRPGDIRQAVEFAAALEASGTAVALHVFEGRSFEGHVQMLLRLGEADYPATSILDEWLERYVPVA